MYWIHQTYTPISEEEYLDYLKHRAMKHILEVVEMQGISDVSERCKGITTKGERCKRMAGEDKEYCFQHE